MNTVDTEQRPDAASAKKSKSDSRLLPFLKEYAIAWVLLALILIGYIATPDFLTLPNAVIILRQTALVGIVAVGMTFVILTSGIDLSVGSIVGLSAVLVSWCVINGYGVFVSVVVGLLMGAVIGALNGFGVVFAKVPPFVMTLGMMTMARGLALTISNGRPQPLGAEADSFRWLGAGDVLGIPVPVVLFVVVVAVAGFTLRYTAFGRSVYAVGDNSEAARLSGIKVRTTTLLVYVIAGLLAGLTGAIYVSRLTVGEPNAGLMLELDAIAVVVIGGTSLFGGQGRIWGTVVGAFIVTILANILDLLAVSPFTQEIVKGAIVVTAVVLERLQNRRKDAS